jgi:hypothetical protein
MSVAEKAAALLEAITREEVDAMPPAARRRFAALARRAAEMADPPPETPKAGILSDLRRGIRAE